MAHPDVVTPTGWFEWHPNGEDVLMPLVMIVPEPEELARRFHEAYERLAPGYDYRPRAESSVPWADVPQKNKDLMIATARAVIGGLRAR